jgi:hypothetical protein
MNQETSASSHILSGWKDIANYLGKGIRTVQRYEGDLRLPVRRPAGRARGSVVATKQEIDSWIAASPIRERSKSGVTDTGPVLSMETMKKRIEEMVRLRSQMRELRVDLRDSLSVLSESLRSLQAQMKRDEYSSPQHRVIVGAGWRNTRTLAAMAEELTLRKAS